MVEGKITIVNRHDDKIIGEINNESGLISALYKRSKENDEMTLDIEVVYTDSHLIKKGHSIIIADEEGILREFDIEDYEEIDGELVIANCLPTYRNDLGLSKPISPRRDLNNLATNELLNELIDETIWESGYVDYVGGIPFEREKYEYPLDLINRLKEQRNLVVDYYVEVNLGRVISRKIDLRIPSEINNGKEITDAKDLNKLSRRESIIDTRTAVKVIGKRTTQGEDAEGNTIDIEEDVEVEVYNDTIQNQIGKPGDYKWEILELDIGNEEDLISEGNKKLQEISKVFEGFEVDVEDLSAMFPHESVRYGDIVHIKDTRMTPVLIVRGEIVGVEYNINDASTKKYIVGDTVRLKTKLDDLGDIVAQYDNRINRANEYTKQVVDRLVEIGGPIKKDDGEGEIHYTNLLTNPNIREVVGGTLEHLDYEGVLGVSAKSSTTLTSHMGGTRNTAGYNLMMLRGMELGMNKMYTLRFRAKADTSLTIKLYDTNSAVPYVLVDGNRLTEANVYVDATSGTRVNNYVNVQLSGTGWKTVEMAFVTESGGDIDIGTPAREKQVDFEEFILYEGTPLYGVTNLFKDWQIDTSTNQGTVEKEGSKYKFSIGGYGGHKTLTDIVLTNDSADIKVYNLMMKIKHTKFNLARTNGDMRLTGSINKFLIGSSDYDKLFMSTKNAEIDEYIRGFNQRYGGLIPHAILEREGVPHEVEISVVVSLGAGTDQRLRLQDSTASAGDELGVEISDIRLYEGIAPKGVVREGEVSEEEYIPDLSNQIGILQHQIHQKADKDHETRVEEVIGIKEGIATEVEGLGYAKTEDVKQLRWEIDSINGLRSALNTKLDADGTVLISQVDGLSDTIQGILDVLEELQG